MSTRRAAASVSAAIDPSPLPDLRLVPVMLRTFPILTLAALFLTLLAATPAQAQQAQTLRITAHDDGSNYFFTVQGLERENPTIRLRPGSSVTVEFHNAGPNQTHNVHFGGGIDEATAVLPPGENETLRFTVPQDAPADAEYWCDPHRELGMVGDLRVEAAPGSNGTGGTDNGSGVDDAGDDGLGDGGPGDGADEEPDNDSPGPGLPLVLASLVALAVARRRR